MKNVFFLEFGIIFYIIWYCRKLKKKNIKLKTKSKLFLGIAIFCTIGSLVLLTDFVDGAYFHSILSIIFYLLFKITTKITKNTNIYTNIKSDVSSSGYHNIKIEKTLNTSPPKTNNINDLNEFYKNKSDELYKIHLSNINNFSIKPHQVDNSPLTSVEKSFLKYINSLPLKNPYIAEYWTYEYNIDYNKVVNKFIDNGYLEIKNRKQIEKMTIPELKYLL